MENQIMQKSWENHSIFFAKRVNECDVGEFKRLNNKYIVFDTNVLVYDENNEIIAIFYKKCMNFEKEMLQDIGKQVKQAANENCGRGFAGGKIELHRLPVYLQKRMIWDSGNEYQKHYLTKTGAISKHKHGNSAYTGVLGYVDRRHTGKSLSYWTTKISNLDKLQKLLLESQAVYQIVANTHYILQLNAVKNSLYSFMSSCFTSITVNHNFITAVHKDSNNFKEGFSIMTVIELKPFHGMELLLPEYNLGFNVRNNDLLFLNPNVKHCNNDGIKNGSRVSLVMYAKQSLVNKH